MDTRQPDSNKTRRDFLKVSGAALIGSTMLERGARAFNLAPGAWIKGDDTLKIALIGCGGRGTGAIVQALTAAGPAKLVAMADAFQDRIEDSLGTIAKEHPELMAKVDVPADRRFVGFDAYQKAIDLADVVVLTTPPGFRPIHFEYAVQKSKHIFMEKPVAVDAPGVRRVLAAAEEAKKKNLKVAVGLQRHHQAGYLDTVKRIQDGAIGDLDLLRVYWNDSGVWVHPRKPGQSEMEYQMRNWYYFVWICGDHIVEQHIHNLDVANWIKNATPVRAQGQGGRQYRTGIDHGEIYDHHMVEFTYADGTKMLSQCRHIPNTWQSVSEHAHGTKGYADVSGYRIEAKGAAAWKYTTPRGAATADPYQVEHDVLFAAIRNNTPHNEAAYGATSTMTAIFGRMATYSGREISWDEAINSKLALVPTAYDWNGDPPSLPGPDGRYKIPMPGASAAL